MTGFGLGVTDQPGAEALIGTEALAGIPAAPASTTAARKMDTFAAFRLIRPPRERRRPGAGQTENTIPARPAESAAGAATAGRLVQNFMVTPMRQSQFAEPLGHARRPDGGERGSASSRKGLPGPSQRESMSRSRGMPNRSLIADDTPGQVAIRVVEADRVLVVGALVENVEGARAAAAGDSGVVRAGGLGARALADEP